MAREGLMDDTGYHGFDECSSYEHCTKEGFETGVKEFAKWLIDKKVENYSDIVDLAHDFLEE